MLDLEYKYYQENKDSFDKKYTGKHVVIVGREIVGVYESEDIAYLESLKSHDLGTFLIQPCMEQLDEVYMYHSRVSM